MFAKYDNHWPTNYSILLWMISAIILIAACFAGWLWIYATTPATMGSEEQIQIYIPPRTSFPQIQHILITSKAIKVDCRFAILARIIDAANHLQAGEYRFPAAITPYDLLRKLEEGKTFSRVLTIAEGLNIFQVATAFEHAGLADSKAVLTAASDPEFIKSLRLNTDSLEGYLFPDTYYFKRGTDLHVMLSTMVQHMRRVFAEECANKADNDFLDIDCSLAPGVNSLASDIRTSTPVHHSVQSRAVLHLTGRQALILASIVEKETGETKERPIIAQVFLSRLRKKMRLQSDPTVLYGLKEFDSPLSRRDLGTPSPYNTYLLPGLPAGPICNPGRAAIASVIRPAKTNYYYFVSENNGRHYFSKTLAEHNRAVARFQKKRGLKED